MLAGMSNFFVNLVFWHLVLFSASHFSSQCSSSQPRYSSLSTGPPSHCLSYFGVLYFENWLCANSPFSKNPWGSIGEHFTLQQPFPQKEVKVSIQPCLPVAAIPMLLSLFCCVAKIYRICMGQVFVCSSDGGFHCEHFGTDSTLPFSYLPWSD